MPTVKYSDARMMREALNKVTMPKGYVFVPQGEGMWDLRKEKETIGRLFSLGPKLYLEKEPELNAVTEIATSVENAHSEKISIGIIID